MQVHDVYSRRFQVIIATVMQIGPAMGTYGAIMFVSFVFPKIFPVLFSYLVCSLTSQCFSAAKNKEPSIQRLDAGDHATND